MFFEPSADHGTDLLVRVHRFLRRGDPARLKEAVSVEELDESGTRVAIEQPLKSLLASTGRPELVGPHRDDLDAEGGHSFRAAIGGCRVDVDDDLDLVQSTLDRANHSIAFVPADDNSRGAGRYRA